MERAIVAVCDFVSNIEGVAPGVVGGVLMVRLTSEGRQGVAIFARLCRKQNTLKYDRFQCEDQDCVVWICRGLLTLATEPGLSGLDEDSRTDNWDVQLAQETDFCLAMAVWTQR